MPGPRRPDPDLGRWLDVVRETWRAQLSTARSSLDLARSAATGQLDPAAATRAYVRAARLGAERYWRDASRLAAEHALGLARTGQHVASELLDDVAAARRSRARAAGDAAASSAPSAPSARAASSAPAAPSPAAAPTAPATPADAAEPAPGPGPATTSTEAAAPTLTLRGRLGERASGSLTVVNRHPRARRVELRAGTVVDEDGADVAGAVLELDPARTTVPAGGEALVDLGMELVAGVLSVGQSYLVTVQVSGGDDATVVCTVVVDP